MTAALVQFLRARLDEEVAEAAKLDDGDDWEMEPWQVRRDETGAWDSYAYLRIAKARVLAEVDAKRQIVSLHSDPTGHSCSVKDETGYELNFADVGGGEACTTLRLLALPYASHPDFGEDWRP
ncbi:DUF6221 family protein [Streptomyces cinnamoneus]